MLRRANAVWLGSTMSLTLAKAQEQLHDGRMSQRDYDRFYRLWVWCVPRFSGEAAAIQAKLSEAARVGRIRRVQRVSMLAFARPRD